MAVSKKYTAATTGPLPAVPSPKPSSKFGLQLKGAPVAATSWSVTLETSVDGVNFTPVITHAANDGSTLWAVERPAMWLRANVGALTFGSATSINIYAVAT